MGAQVGALQRWKRRRGDEREQKKVWDVGDWRKVISGHQVLVRKTAEGRKGRWIRRAS